MGEVLTLDTGFRQLATKQRGSSAQNQVWMSRNHKRVILLTSIWSSRKCLEANVSPTQVNHLIRGEEKVEWSLGEER